MHTIDLLEEALSVAQRQGYSVRRQWLGENLGGPCRIGQELVLFVNLSLPADEQLKQAMDAVRKRELPVNPPPSQSLLRMLK